MSDVGGWWGIVAELQIFQYCIESLQIWPAVGVTQLLTTLKNSISEIAYSAIYRSAPTNIRISHGDQTVKLTRNLIQSRFVFLKFEDRKFIEIEKCFYSVKVESVSFPVVPVPASNSK